MAGKVNLDPQKGIELAEILNKFCDQECLELASVAYDAVRSLGDDNNCGEQLKERMRGVEANYNNNLVPAFSSLKAAFEEFTDVADYVAKLGIETKVTASDVGTVGGGQFDAAKSL